MASRENQGLQVALILFVMMTVVLMVTTYVFYRKAEENANVAASANQSAQAANAERDKALFRVQVYSFMVGQGDLTRENVVQQLASDPEMQEVFKRFEDDMKVYGEGLPPEELNYPNLPRNIIAAIQAKNVSVTDLTEVRDQKVAEVTKVTTDETVRADAAVAGQEATSKDLEAERSKFAAKVAEFKTKMDESFGKIQVVSKQLNDVRAQAAARLNTNAKTITNLENDKISLMAQADRNRPRPPEKPDGKVTLTNAEGNFVIIDLGSSDGLNTLTTFAVYAANETSLKTAPVKARIEVVDVIGPSRAKARIVSQADVRDPILSGDLVFSQIFRPGYRQRFALAGFMDLNDDRRSDRAYIRNLIIANGGIIDAELLDDGTPEGRITDRTDFLVLGDRPTADTDEAFRNEFGRITDEAVRRSIEQISVHELLKRIGWSPEVRRVSLGKGANEAADQSDFRPRKPVGAPGAGGAKGPY